MLLLYSQGHYNHLTCPPVHKAWFGWHCGIQIFPYLVALLVTGPACADLIAALGKNPPFLQPFYITVPADPIMQFQTFVLFMMS